MSDDPQESRNPEREQEFAAILATAGGPELVTKLEQQRQQLDFYQGPGGLSRIESVGTVQVVLVRGKRGAGTPEDPLRDAVQWWTTTGQLIASAEAPVPRPGFSPS